MLNPDGSESWEFPTEVCVCRETCPAIGHDGTIYFASNATLYALNPGGSIRWTYEDPLVIGGPPAVRSDGVVYLFGSDGRAGDTNACFAIGP